MQRVWSMHSKFFFVSAVRKCEKLRIVYCGYLCTYIYRVHLGVISGKGTPFVYILTEVFKSPRGKKWFVLLNQPLNINKLCLLLLRLCLVSLDVD